MDSDFTGPVNVAGSEEMVTINRLAEINITETAGKKPARFATFPAHWACGVEIQIIV